MFYMCVHVCLLKCRTCGMALNLVIFFFFYFFFLSLRVMSSICSIEDNKIPTPTLRKSISRNSVLPTVKPSKENRQLIVENAIFPEQQATPLTVCNIYIFFYILHLLPPFFY